MNYKSTFLTVLTALKDCDSLNEINTPIKINYFSFLNKLSPTTSLSLNAVEKSFNFEGHLMDRQFFH